MGKSRNKKWYEKFDEDYDNHRSSKKTYTKGDRRAQREARRMQKDYMLNPTTNQHDEDSY